jgi:hypothetical protein
MIAIGNLIRWVGGFLGGIFVTKGVVGGGNNWFLLIAILLGYLIFREFNK